MAEVHEITRTAFNQITAKIYDHRDYDDIEWVAVDCWSEFGVCPDWAHLHINRGFKTSEEAQKHVDFWDGHISGNFWIKGVWYPAHVNESEVWHIVDDEPRARRVDEGCSIFVQVTVPDLSDYTPGTHPVYDYFIRWNRRFVARKGASFYWAFETLTAWDVDTIVGLRTRTTSVVEVLDRETYLIVTGQSDARR